MTNDMNLDDFDQDGFDPSTGHAPRAEGGMKKSLMEAWRTQPLFKLMVIMGVVGLAIMGALGVFSSPPPPQPTTVLRTPELNVAPGGAASPAYNDQIKMANKERVDEAVKQGGSAMPTPTGDNLDINGLFGKEKKDPLAEFRAETERLKQEMIEERKQNAQQMQVMQQQMQQKPQQAPPPEDDSLAQAMQRQMQQLMDAWAPRNMKVVQGVEPKESKDNKTDAAMNGEPIIQASTSMLTKKTKRNIIQAGTVSYGQMLMEANSDIPGPILAQVLSGPFSGARAVGRFQTMNDYLVIQFNLINFKGKDYSVNVLALDPDTTLGGMATDVDHRYFDRVLLPAAASFVSQFGSVLSQPNQTYVVTDNAVLVETAKAGYKDAIYSGLGSAAQSAAGFLQQQASQIKPLVRVETGTPLGLFFLTSVAEGDEGQDVQNAAWQKSMAGMGEQALGGGASPIPGYASSGVNSANMFSNQYSGSSAGGMTPTTYNPYMNPYANSYGNPYSSGPNVVYPNSSRLPGSSISVITR